MFMSLFIVSFFVALQAGFLNFLDSSEKMWSNVQTNIVINSIIDSLQSNPISEVMTGWFLIKSIDYNLSWYSWGLNYNEAKEYIITSTWWATSLGLQVTSWWPLEYNVISYNLSESGTLFNSWVILNWNSASLNLDSTKKFNIIAVRSLWWYSEYFLKKSTTDLLSPENTYEILKDYGSWQNPIRTEKVINFAKKSSWINYDKFSIFLNSSNYE